MTNWKSYAIPIFILPGVGHPQLLDGVSVFEANQGEGRENRKYEDKEEDQANEKRPFVCKEEIEVMPLIHYIK